MKKNFSFYKNIYKQQTTYHIQYITIYILARKRESYIKFGLQYKGLALTEQSPIRLENGMSSFPGIARALPKIRGISAIKIRTSERSTSPCTNTYKPCIQSNAPSYYF